MTCQGGIAGLLHHPMAAARMGKQNAHLEAHSGYECFTVLLCSSTSGPEILSPANQWIFAEATSVSFIVNVADFLMR